MFWVYKKKNARNVHSVISFASVHFRPGSSQLVSSVFVFSFSPTAKHGSIECSRNPFGLAVLSREDAQARGYFDRVDSHNSEDLWLTGHKDNTACVIKSLLMFAFKEDAKSVVSVFLSATVRSAQTTRPFCNLVV